jgi:hypothetical protein
MKKQMTPEQKREYNSRPEQIQKRKEYYSRQDIKERNERLRKIRRQNPEYRKRENEKSRERASTVEFKAKMKSIRSSDEYKKYRNAYNKEYFSNSHNKLIKNIRARVRKFLKNKSQTNIRSGVCCTKEYLIKHIERKFKKGMTWDNYGIVWHIDHIIPLSKFPNNEEEAIKANHFSNLQPMFAIENIIKKNKILKPAQPELIIQYK